VRGQCLDAYRHVRDDCAVPDTSVHDDARPASKGT
jgi:hypothetical protein